MSIQDDTIFEEENGGERDAAVGTSNIDEQTNDDYVVVDDDGNLHIRSNGEHFQVSLSL